MSAPTQEACGQERLRTARDLHDGATHALVAVAPQARAGTWRVLRDPAAAEAVLARMPSAAP